MHDVPSMRAKFEALRPYLDERRRRLWAAAEAMVLGRGGITAGAKATRLQRPTICAGIPELRADPRGATRAHSPPAAHRVPRGRAPGGGPKPPPHPDPTLGDD